MKHMTQDMTNRRRSILYMELVLMEWLLLALIAAESECGER